MKFSSKSAILNVCPDYKKHFAEFTEFIHSEKKKKHFKQDHYLIYMHQVV